jgi:murein DD-endopeptidase MepM/ murein hydrolase activator NlpD
MAARVTAPGKVVRAGWAGGYGRMVEVDHGNGFSTRYGHLSKILAKVGQTVAAGDEIGETGSSGRSTGPHLHYEVRHNGEPVNPLRFLKVGRQVAKLL